MISLGISEDLFDAGATLCDGERVIFASNEERYTRRKNEGGFPHRSLQALFEATAIAPGDIDRIYVCGEMTPPFPVRLFPRVHYWLYDAKRDRRNSMFRKFMDAVTFLTPMSHTGESSWMRKFTRPLLPMVARRLLPKELRKTPIQFVEHHQCHAAGAYTFSGFERALCITSDGMGDGLSLTVSECAPDTGVQRLWAATSQDSFGLFFEILAEAFGFVPCRDEGKITGLAACGKPENVKESPPFALEQGRLQYTGPHGAPGVRWARQHLMKLYSREDLAAWAQQQLEDHLLEIARWWLRDTGHHNLAVAGGVFVNVKLNQRLHELEEVENLFVYPNMGDGGLSLGAICEGGGMARTEMADVFFGDMFTEEQMEAALKEAGLEYERHDDIAVRIGELLHEGVIVARFDGRMEWGPRALGNRSILVRTTDRAVVDKLNELLDRSDFMPFAPALLDEDAEEYLLDVDAGRHAAEFMTVCFNCTDKMKREHPAIVHVDGTARAQLVRKDHNPNFYRILEEYKKHSGDSVVLNTSFNIHEEPIVCTPKEGVAAFLHARLDYLAMGPFLARRKPVPSG